MIRNTLIGFLLIIIPGFILHAQQDIKAYLFTGIVFDSDYNPLPNTHVIAKGTGQGDVTDEHGVFIIYIRERDQLSFFNLTCNDTSAIVNKDLSPFNIQLKRRVYLLKEAKIFEWGSTYDEFPDEVKRNGVPVSKGKELGLPTQDPFAIPFYLDDEKIKSTRFLISSPVSFLYYNLSKREKAIRKTYRLEKDKEQIDLFEQTVSPQNINAITGLQDRELEEFIIYLNLQLSCTYQCAELELLTEIYSIWNQYRERSQPMK
jgi:hypothetical protein